MSEWISVKDKLPENNDEDIFITYKSSDGKRYYAWWKGFYLLEEFVQNSTTMAIDYWMKVPKINED